ncbi:MAG: calcium/sodium antiporter [Planctomycetes bacterium]|nr:calcium/sodium antiporter [Planctomycetota bacterium]
MAFDVILCLLGFLLLYFGADWLVKGSSSLARSLGVTPLAIGLTVVAFGTSTPEFVVSVLSSFREKSMIAVGNVVGSNICNVALILGLAAAIHPLTTDRGAARRDNPIMLGVSLLLLAICLDSRIGRIEGAALFLGIIAYTLMNYRFARREGREDGCDKPDAAGAAQEVGFIASRPRQILYILLGIAGVVYGAHLVVGSAVKIMTVLGVSEKFIGLTVVAVGTSLPELATSVVAALRGEMNISVGNIIGSNVFNILSVLGVAALVRPITIPGGFIGSGMWIDYTVMVFTSALPLVMMWKAQTVARKDGVLLLLIYAGYVAFLVKNA